MKDDDNEQREARIALVLAIETAHTTSEALSEAEANLLEAKALRFQAHAEEIRANVALARAGRAHTEANRDAEHAHQKLHEITNRPTTPGPVAEN